jgi:hypothetical protein
MTPDLAARKILVAAYLYYNHAHSIMGDGEYDKTSQYVADSWNELSPLRQWCLGDPNSTRATGAHFKFTRLCVGAARELFPYQLLECKWRFNTEHQVHYTKVTG